MVIDDSASEAQREALLTIMSGQETDAGATMWNVFASTMAEVFEPVFEHIDLSVDVEQRIGKLSVEGLIESNGEPIKHIVSGENHRARIDLPSGFEYSIAEIGSATAKSSGPVSISHENSNAQFAHIHLNNHGVVRH